MARVPARPALSARATVGLATLAIAVFLVHAIGYFDFFVDDEGIPFAYAQQLLEGRGLSYNKSDGPAEGYSDFLHVLIAGAILEGVRIAGAPKIDVFPIAKAWSLVVGAGVLAVVAWLLRRARADGIGMAAGLLFLAFSGPLAVWSCSSLETAEFALVLTVLLAALLEFDLPHAPVVAAAAAILLVLLRIDGFVYAGVLLAAFIACGAVDRRQALVTVVSPLAVAFALYHGWRAWYFGDVLPAPVSAKVLHKLAHRAHVIIKPPARNYLLSFFAAYDWLLLPVALVGMWRRRMEPTTWAVGVALGSLWMFLAVVGDWMFGFRFAVATLPLVAFFVAVASTGVPSRALAIGALAGLLAWTGHEAVRVSLEYAAVEQRPNWWRHRSFDPAVMFGEYYALYKFAQPVMPPGTRTVFSQAGFVPFMLDLDNIDSLGICSRFVAELPTTDVFFTEVGRYSPLTDAAVLRASETYALCRRPSFVIERRDLLLKANEERVPARILSGTFHQIGTDARAGHVVYAPVGALSTCTGASLDQFRENLLHPSYIRNATADGRVVPERDYLRTFGFTSADRTRFFVRATHTMSATFATDDPLIYQFYAGEIRVKGPVRLHLELRTRTGASAYSYDAELAPGKPRRLLVDVPAGTRASSAELTLVNEASGTVRVWLTDMRLQGQTHALREFVAARLTGLGIH